MISKFSYDQEYNRNNIMATEREQVGDCPDDLEYVEEEETLQDIAEKLLQKSDVLEQLQNERNVEILTVLPHSIKRRIKALKKIQLEVTNIEAQFFKDVHALECTYHKLYEPLFEKRSIIVNGSYEPIEEECQWPSDEEDLPEALKEKMKIVDYPENETEDQKGIPEFWLTIFKNVSLLSEMVKPHDVPILTHLTDIRVVCKEDPMGFLLEFHFSPNQFFTNSILIKEYEMKCSPDYEDPFGFEGPEIYKCSGCEINWNKGKNVTLKTVKKKQKHKSTGVVRTVTKTVQNDSFFNFFNPPNIPEETKDEDVDEDLRCLLVSDFEIGHYIRERVIPRAVLYFTGEAIEDEEDSEEEEEDDDDDQEDSDEKETTPKNIEDCDCEKQ
ncbi:unnamed protein product [Phaedon cochleariae]|uniref:Nucleosome assembly protein 1-like 1 n=1 Tax=Phaedon cochleariae TaxID=80249 RepID=A0A9P0GVS5_PHACE|nr:unnamed protein product [Phaedon cochleariae]